MGAAPIGMTILALLVACVGTGAEEDCATSPDLCASGDGGTGGDVAVPPGCDLTKSAKDSPACIDDGVAVFVSASGDDGASGKKTAPVRSVAKGVELAARAGLPRVYVCEGSYDASVEIKSAVSVYGGLSCAWAYTGAKPKLAPVKGVALRVTKVSGAVAIEDLEVVGAADASVAGDSAIAVFVSESSDVRFERVVMSAGKGTDGETKAQVAQAGNAAKGADAVNPNGGAGGKTTCPDGESVGGTGGTIGANDATAGTPGLSGGQPGAAATDCSAGGSGKAGSNGGDGAAASAVVGLGALSATSWAAAAGTKGSAGTRAQGGGGGGARAGAGGGGGAGGCGGEGGQGGGGGGASVPLVAFNSTITLRATQLTSSNAGNGGSGAPGQLGQPFGGGGNGGTANPTNGCAGGQGGTGGNGGAGGGGAGGVSAGVLYKGPEPTKDDATKITTGTAGAAGKGGAAGNDGPAGVSAPVVKAD